MYFASPHIIKPYNKKALLEKYVNRLQQNTNILLETVEGYPIEYLTKKEPSEWSVLEILEHIYLADKVIHRIVSTPSDNAFANKEILGRQKLETILVGHQYVKVQSPDILQPKGRFKNLAEFNLAFSSLRATIQNDLVTKKIVVDNRIHNHPMLGEMTILDWLNFILYHTERHLKQIKRTVANN